MTTIPNLKKWFQSNVSNVLGNLWSTFNVDLTSNIGALRVSPRLRTSTSSATTSNFGLPYSFAYADLAIWAICGGRVFKNFNGIKNAAFVEDASTGAVTTYTADSDLAVFNSRLWSKAATKLYSKALNNLGTGAWTERDTVVDAQNGGLEHFLKLNRLYYTDDKTKVRSIDTSDVVATSGDYTITLTGFYIQAIKATSDSIWITAYRLPSLGEPVGDAYVFRWDGISSQASEVYRIPSRNVVAMAVDKDTLHIMDANGYLRVFNGTGFSELARLPYGDKPAGFFYVRRNGMAFTKKGTLLINVQGRNADTSSSTNENLPSGIWEYSKETGFVHRYGFSYMTGASDTQTDNAQFSVSNTGAIGIFDGVANSTSGSDGTFLAGATVFTDASSTAHVMAFDNTLDTIKKAGYFVTTWLESANIEDTWKNLWVVYRRLLDSSDTIVAKYRLTEETPVTATITWVDTTHFTTTTNVSSYANSVTAEAGGEVEILQGTGGGTCRHITGVSNNAGTYTVTLDSAVTGVTTGTAKARFQNWVKLPVITGQENGYTSLSIEKNSTRIQFKVYAEFTGEDEIHKLEVDQTAHLVV